MAIRTWIAGRIEAGIEATPWWVFVHGPRWLGSLLVGGLFFYGVHAATGVSLNPFENLGELVSHLEQRRAALLQ